MNAVLGSGSRGNAVAVSTPQGILLIDAGFGPRALARRLQAVGLPSEPIAGVIVNRVRVPEPTASGARLALDRMLAIR